LTIDDKSGCTASEEIFKVLQGIWAFWILAIMGFSTLKLFGAKLINVQRSPDAATNKVIVITVAFLLFLILLRSAIAVGPFQSPLKGFLAPLFPLFPKDVSDPPILMYFLLYFLMGVSINSNNSNLAKIFLSGILGPIRSTKARVSRSRALWFLKAGGRYDVRIGVILCIIFALPLILGQAPEPNNFPQLGWDSITVLLYLFVSSFLTTTLPEELLFRGFLQTSLTRRFKSTNWGLFWASLAFGVYHIPRYFQRFSPDCQAWLSWRLIALAFISTILGEFMVGLFLGFAYSSRGSLVIPIMVHTSINTISRFLLPEHFSKAVKLLSDWGVLKPDSHVNRYVNLYVAVALILIVLVVFWVLHWCSTTRLPNRRVKKLLNTLDQSQLVKLLKTEEPWRSKKCADKLAQKIVDSRESDILNSVDDLEKDVPPEKLEELRGELEILRRLLQEMGTDLNAATLEQLTSVLVTKLTKIQDSDSRKNAYRAYLLACTIIACRPLAVESLKEPEEPKELDELEKLLVESLKKREEQDELKELLQETPGKLRELVNAGIFVLPS